MTETTGPRLINPLRVNTEKFRVKKLTRPQEPMQTKAKVPEEGKAYASLIKKVEVKLTPEGIKVDLIR